MIDCEDRNFFSEILSPVKPLIEKAADGLESDKETYTLSLAPFIMNILFAIFNKIPSVRLLITEIKTSETAEKLNLVDVQQATYNEAFNRYDPKIFREIFHKLLSSLNLLIIPEIQALGKILLIDGSIFPAMESMMWAAYKSGANAIKMNLAFELNRMIPVEFSINEGKCSERKFVSEILQEAVTYVCDRGYISFKLFKEICIAEAFFIIRGKFNMKYIVKEQLDIMIPDEFLNMFAEIEDLKVVFENDPYSMVYRVVIFKAMGENYILITNRFDLTTSEIIMLYAYRWQIELFFRSIKRTFQGIHLMHESPHGIEIQFYLYLIGYLLLISFKQECEAIHELYEYFESIDQPPEDPMVRVSREIELPERPYVQGLVTKLGKNLQRYWKIGLHWLTSIKNLLGTPFSVDIIRLKVARE